MLGKQKKHAAGESDKILTLLGRDTEIEGTISFKETIRVDGRVRGKLISTDGTVIIGENAIVDADIQVGVAIIRGQINGRVEALQRIDIHSPAQVKGDISAPRVSIGSGVQFNGQCIMPKPAQKTGKETEKAAKDQPCARSDSPQSVKKL